MSKSSSGKARRRAQRRSPSAAADPIAEPVAASLEEETPDGADSKDSPPSEFPDLDEEATDELLAVLQECLQGVRVDDLLTHLRQLPPNGISYVMRFLGLMRAARVNQGMASALLTRLRTRPNLDLLAFILKPMFDLFDHAHLADEQWARLLSGDWDATVTVLEEDRAFAWDLDRGTNRVAPRLFPATLAVAALTSRVPIPALAFLCQENETAAKVYAGLRAEHPSLPVADASLLSITPNELTKQAEDAAAIARLAAALDSISNPHIDDPEEFGDVLHPDSAEDATERQAAVEPTAHAAPAGDLDGDTAGAAVDDDSGKPLREDDVGNAHAAVEAVTHLDWEVAAAAADRAAANLQERRSPSMGDVELILEFTEEAHAAAELMTMVTGSKVAATADELAGAAAQVTSARANETLLRELATLEGPVELDEQITVIRRITQQVLDGVGDDGLEQGLLAFAELARLGRQLREGTAKEYGRISQFESEARSQLPAVTLPAIPAALLGDLRLGASATAAHGGRDAGRIAARALPDSEQHPGHHVATKAPAGPAAEGSESADAATYNTDTAPHVLTASPAPPLAWADADADADGGGAADDEAPDEGAAADQAAGEVEETHRGVSGDGVGKDDEEDQEELDLDELARFLESPAAGPARIRSTRMTANTGDNEGAEYSAASAADSRTIQRTTADDAAPSASPRTAAVSGAEDGDPHAELRDLEARLLSQGRFGLASLLHRNPAHAAARRLAAYQTSLTSSTGSIAAAFAEDQQLVGRDTLADDRPGQFLAWAAAARVALLAPASGADQVLDDLAPCLAAYPTLSEFGHELAAASRSGAIALPEHSEDVSAQHRASEAAHAAISQARELLENAPRRNLKYAPATTVYQHLMSSEGEFGRLLGRVAGNTPEAAKSVQTEIVELRRNLDRLIDDTAPRVVRSTRTRRIEAGARAALLQRLNEVLAVAAEWAEAATTSLELHARLRGAARASRPLDNLRAHLERVHGAAFNELDQLRASSDTETARGRLEKEAIDALAGIVVATFDICNGKPPQHPEPSPWWLIRGELLAADVALDALLLLPVEDAVAPDTTRAGQDMQPEQSMDSPAERVLLTARELAATDRMAPEDVYARRKARGDHDLTEVLVDNLACTAPDAAALLRVERDSDVAQLRPAVEREVAAVIDLVNGARRDETLPENVWSALLARLEPLTRHDRSDFGRIRAELTDIARVVHGHTAKVAAAARLRVHERAEVNPLVAENRDRLIALLDGKDVVGADEFLEQLMSGEALPEAHEDDDVHLARFFPAVPALLEQHPRLLEDLQAYVGTGAAVPAGPLSALFSAAIEAQVPSNHGRPVGRQAIGAWLQLASRPKRQQVDVGTLLKAILAVMGLEFRGSANLDTGDLRGRRFVTVRGVDGVGKALVPALGSQMTGRVAVSAQALGTLRVLLVHEPVAPATLMSWLAKEPEEQTVLVLYLTGTVSVEQRRALAAASRGRSRPVAVVVDAAVMAYLAVQNEPSRTTLAAITVPFTAASPYRDTPGDTPPEMFYGRVDELRAVRDLAGPSFVSGGRQLGKSALLRTALRTFDNGKTRRALLIDVKPIGAIGGPEEMWSALNGELRANGLDCDDSGAPPTAESVTDAIRTWLDAEPDRALLILVDEADNFLSADADRGRFSNVHACKRLMEGQGRRVKFVFAGLHRTSRFESLPNQPLAHMGKPIVVGPLRAQAAQDLITRPMSALGFTFSNAPAQTARILAATNSVPSLLQLFGEALVEHMKTRDIGDGPPQRITDDDIATVLANRDLAERFREKYILTLNLDHRYQVIVHTVAQAAYEHGVDAGLRLRDLEEQCRQFWPEGFAGLPIDHLRALVTECCDLGLLTEEGSRYRMRTPYVLRLLGSLDEITEVLYGAQERLTLPSTLDANSYRAAFGGGGKRSPLTAQQVGDLFAKDGSTHVVVGSEALGAGRVIPYLESYADEGRARGYATQRITNLTPVSLVAHARRLTKPTMLLVDLRMSSPAQVADLLAATTEAHAQASAPMLVTVVAGLASSPAWIQDADTLVVLRRVDRPGLRMWCEEADSTFDVPEVFENLAALTGGWTYLIDRALGRRESDAPATAIQRLDKLAIWLEQPEGAKDLVTACGLVGDGSVVVTALKTVFDAVAEWTGGEPAPWGDVVMLLEEDTDSPVRASVLEAGFSGVADALQVLLATGMLTTQGSVPSEMNISVEPVLAAAVAVLNRPTEEGT